jgi:tripartite-type tricarboxylate transporter receptor subunit TctC
MPAETPPPTKEPFMIRTATRIALACAAVCLAMPSFAQSPAFPTKPVRLVVASAGSPQDVVARIVGQKLGEIWKQGVVVENRAGAGSLLSIQTVTKAAPDGYTILVASSAYAITPPFYPEAGFDAEKDLIPVAMLAASPNIIVASPSLNARDLQDVIARAKKGEKLQFGSPGHGTGPALVMEYLVKVLAKVDMTHVPYKGAVAPMTAASTGEVAIASVGLAPAMPFVKSGKVTALAVTSGKRSPALPNVPTMAESGFPAFEDEQWIGAWVPAKTPQAIVQLVSDDMAKAVQSPDVKERLGSVGYEVSTMKRDDFAAYVRKELAKWARIVKETGAKPE